MNKKRDEDQGRRVPKYLQNNMGGSKVKANKENIGDGKGQNSGMKRTNKEISQMNKLELERLVHHKGNF